MTPLYLAAQSGHLELCRVLVRHKADHTKAASLKDGTVILPTDVSLSQVGGGPYVYWHAVCGGPVLHIATCYMSPCCADVSLM